MKLLLLIIITFVLTGCSTYQSNKYTYQSSKYTYQSSKPFPLEVGDPITVRECRLVGKYPGPYGYRFWGPPPVVGDFKYRTALKAREAGATHIYWREDVRGYYGETRVMGYAFDCTGVATPKYYDDFY